MCADCNFADDCSVLPQALEYKNSYPSYFQAWSKNFYLNLNVFRKKIKQDP